MRARGAPAAERARYLEESAAAYQTVLEEQPAHAATATNLALVYRRMGDVSGIDALRARFAGAALATRRTLANTHADALLASGDTLGAIGVLEDLLLLDGDPDTVLGRMASVFAGAPDAALIAPLIEVLGAWGDTAPNGREIVLRTLCLHEDVVSRRVWNTALTEWGLAAAGLGLVNAGDIEALFPGTTERAIRDLGSILVAPPEVFAPDQLGEALDVLSEWGDYAWWTAGSDRRHALAGIALARGHLELRTGQPEQALHWWTWGLAVSPDVYQYDTGAPLGAREAIPLELLSQLVALVDRRRESLDPDGRRFDRFINLLFSGKSSAYAFGDLRSIQRHHTILGRIFAAQGRWDVSGSLGARFQLENALSAASRRAQTTGVPVPLPDIKMTLADGLRSMADADERNAVRLRERAAELYVDAAVDYLDLDDLLAADTVLQRAVDATGGNDRLEAIAAVSRLRRDFPTDGEVVVTGAWAAELDPEFVSRQQFKLLADAAVARGDETDARRALTVAADLGVLASRGDAIRLEEIAAQLSDLGSIDVRLAASEPRTTDDELLWQLPAGDGEATYLSAKGAGIKAAFPAVGVYFDPNDVAVDAVQANAVQALVRQAEEDPEAHFTLTATTDHRGRADRNEALSLERGEEVKAVLIEAGVDEDRITIRALGESRKTALPVAAELERRVHVRVDRAGRIASELMDSEP